MRSALRSPTAGGRVVAALLFLVNRSVLPLADAGLPATEGFFLAGCAETGEVVEKAARDAVVALPGCDPSTWLSERRRHRKHIDEDMPGCMATVAQVV